jgi:excisionase family DNA binding protein
MRKRQFNYILLNSREAAEQLDMSPDTVNLLARSRKLPGVKVGRQWRFKRRDITLLKKHLDRMPQPPSPWATQGPWPVSGGAILPTVLTRSRLALPPIE